MASDRAMRDRMQTNKRTIERDPAVVDVEVDASLHDAARAGVAVDADPRRGRGAARPAGRVGRRDGERAGDGRVRARGALEAGAGPVLAVRDVGGRVGDQVRVGALGREARAGHAAAGLAAFDVAARGCESSGGEEERDEGRGEDHFERCLSEKLGGYRDGTLGLLPWRSSGFYTSVVVDGALRVICSVARVELDRRHGPAHEHVKSPPAHMHQHASRVARFVPLP
ncbi:unnamed protein product [Mycena citricolor]|uniref:Uncharacterized protein n=1 Tax=Mycena citricolor TaxID=2018698 RepID=A0AAD2H090_9AGAR|nr:unnamed protein product [Mycena citricolor]